MRLLTANVNGIRAALRRGGVDWLAAQEPDVLTLQEVRATEAQLNAALAGSSFADWTIALEPGAVAGRAGVAVLIRPGEAPTGRAALAKSAAPAPAAVPVRTSAVLGVPGIADGRWIEVDVPHGSDTVTVISSYVHTGSVGLPIQDDKYAMLDAISDRLDALRAQGSHVVLTGDLNICHTEQDLKNWKGNRGKAGFLPEERAYLTRWFETGWVDVGRNQAGAVDGPYTWWSWRGQAFDNDAGWRIDYQIASPALASAVRGSTVGRASSYAQRWSDHAAVVVDYGCPEADAWQGG